MSPLSEKNPLCLPLSVFCLLLLVPLVLLLVGGGGLFIHYSREIVTDSSRAYGQYRASLDLAERGADIRTQLWFLTSTPVWRKNVHAWEECRRQLQSLAAASSQAAPHAHVLLEKLESLRILREQLAKIDALRSEGQTSLLLEQRNALDNQADGLLRSLPELVQHLEQATSAAQDMGAQLRANAVSAQEQENRMLLFLVAAAAYLVLVIWLVQRQVVRPLMGIRGYVGRLGTGVAVEQPPHSHVLVIADIAEALENLAVYLGQATVRSEKIETERTQFRRMSLYDGLTNLYNRRAFDEALQKLWAKARQSGKPLGIVMMDVDKFKVYNDSCGHQAGDVCLRKVAGAVAKAVREGDVAARYGGEEFVVILPDTDKTQAFAAAERIREAVEAVKLPHPGSPAGPYVTVSLGVTAEATAEGSTPTDLVRHADEALYLSKKNGRNRATIYEVSTDGE
ncbi:MAG: GGDEF domain-containing protein [Desulfovibrio sp.]|nr:GGDEF domain-containing protein [Desulfovibrio sp.]